MFNLFKKKNQNNIIINDKKEELIKFYKERNLEEEKIFEENLKKEYEIILKHKNYPIWAVAFVTNYNNLNIELIDIYEEKISRTHLYCEIKKNDSYINFDEEEIFDKNNIKYIFLNTIEVIEDYHRLGFGTLMFECLLKFIEENKEIKFTHIRGFVGDGAGNRPDLSTPFYKKMESYESNIISLELDARTDENDFFKDFTYEITYL